MNLEISRSEAVNLWSACRRRAKQYRNEAKLRGNAGPRNAEYRATCREKATELDELAARIAGLVAGSCK